MQHQEGSFQGFRGASIYYQFWLPEGESKAVLLIVHGLAEHSGRYMNVVNHFVPLDYAVYGIDHLGHGKSSGTRVYVEKFEDFTETLRVYFDMVHKWQLDKPIFLVGHSMGGLISAIYLLNHQPGLKGAVFSGPSVKVPGNISKAIIFVGNALSALMPKFKLIGWEAEAISRDPLVVKAYLIDPLVHKGKITARLGVELLKAMQRVTAEASKIQLPVLVVQGSADRLVEPDGAQMLYDMVSSVDKTIKIYDGLYHEVFNEPEHNQVLCDIKTWIEAHLDFQT